MTALYIQHLFNTSLHETKQKYPQGPELISCKTACTISIGAVAVLEGAGGIDLVDGPA